MFPISEFNWQPITALHPLLLTVEGVLEVTASQLQDLLRAKKAMSLLEQKTVECIKDTHLQRQSHLALYKLLCHLYKTIKRAPNFVLYIRSYINFEPLHCLCVLKCDNASNLIRNALRSILDRPNKRRAYFLNCAH